MIKQLFTLICFMHLFSFGCKTNKIENKEASKNEKSEVEAEVKPTAEPKYITNKRGDKIEVVEKNEEAWKKILSKEQYYVLREKGTERAFSGAYWDNKKEGLYSCAACNQVLFTSGTKFDSGTGWPSFFKADDDLMIKKATDYNLGYGRTEVMCARCEGHLGHLFDDGPPPTGLRYCINSVSLTFTEANYEKK